jgi:soluble lytic murein transglycosylase
MDIVLYGIFQQIDDISVVGNREGFLLGHVFLGQRKSFLCVICDPRYPALVVSCLDARGVHFRDNANSSGYFYRLERYEEALKLWEWLALNGKSYGESSVRRLGILAGQGEREKTLESLQRIADRGNSTVRPKALYSLYTLVPEEQKEFLKKELIDKYAMTEGTQAILWDDAWQAWKKGNTREALRIWEHFLSLSNGTMRERLLYWTARGYEKLEQKGKAEELFHTLISDYPLSIYSFLASPGGPSFTGETPSELEREKCELEEWGFVFYARLRLLKEGSSSAYYRAAILSEWLEDEPGAYSAASTLASALLKKNPLPKKGICFLYPRPGSRKRCEFYTGKGACSNVKICGGKRTGHKGSV